MWNELKFKYNQAQISEKLIFVNVGIFAILSIITTVCYLLTDSHIEFFKDNLALPANLKSLLFKPWTLITFFFTHFHFWHLLGNMIALYFFGRFFSTFFNARLFLNYFILGGLFSGLIFVVSYNVFPALIGANTSLVGASGAVFAILFGATAKAPNYIFNFFGVLRIPLWVLSSLYTIMFISSIPYANAGGELAHLGGAFLGYFYTKQLDSGKNIGAFLERIMEAVRNMFKAAKKGPLKTVHKNKSKVGGYTKSDFKKFNNQKRIDVILDKISKSGYDSLTADEKELLFRAGK
ncbi:MAG: rhomboid family intramembrane serine protease [Algibacter sp.]